MIRTAVALLSALLLYRCPIPVEQTYPDGCNPQQVPCIPGDNS